MARHAAFLRGVSPLALKMPVLARTLQDCGFDNVRTLLSSGNAVFQARTQRRETLERRIEAALQVQAGRTFATFVRGADELERIVARSALSHPSGTKRIVVFLRDAPSEVSALPFAKGASALLECIGTEAYGYYTPGNDASAFMAALERRFGTAFTTRTVETVRRCTGALSP